MVALGIDIGGTNTALGLVTEDGRVIARTGLPTGADPDPAPFVAAVAAAAAGLRRESGVPLIGAGVGAPNGNARTGTVDDAPNLAWEGVVPLAALLSEALALPVSLTNDANAAALGELQFGGARGMRDVAVITLGTGLGSGIIVDGRLLTGHSGVAGELGHVCVIDGGRVCGCGRRGCLETYVSAPGIRRTVLELLADDPVASGLRGIPFEELDARQISAAAVQGDPVALRAFERTGALLGRALADLVAVTSPEAIFLFGGLANAGDLLLEPTIRAFDGALLGVFRGTVSLRRSEVPGDNAAVLGAAALAWSAFGAHAAGGGTGVHGSAGDDGPDSAA